MIAAALYIDPRGPYPRMTDVDCWDESRDARQYSGPHPVVAHPPCGAWSLLRHMSRGEGRDCGPRAVEQVRSFGGVLEQPAESRLWAHCRLPMPGELPDEHGGFSIGVEQVAWGHVARKRTWLYFVGIDRWLVESTVRIGGTPTHWCSGGGTGRGRTPPGIRVCSAQQRRRTPPAFSEWLVELARTARLSAVEAAE
jgi:hypothetical protein